MVYLCRVALVHCLLSYIRIKDFELHWSSQFLNTPAKLASMIVNVRKWDVCCSSYMYVLHHTRLKQKHKWNIHCTHCYRLLSSFSQTSVSSLSAARLSVSVKWTVCMFSLREFFVKEDNMFMQFINFCHQLKTYHQVRFAIAWRMGSC